MVFDIDFPQLLMAVRLFRDVRAMGIPRSVS
jgi:hypothetical protein